MTMMRRYSEELPVVAIKTDSTSPEIDISHAESGEISVPNGEAVVTLTYYTSQPSGTYFAAQDSSGAAVTQTVAQNKSYPIPVAVLGAGRIQIRGNVAGNLKVCLKS